MHSTADCEVGGRLATVAESEAALEVSPPTSVRLRNAAAWHYIALYCRVLNHDERTSRPGR